MAVRAAQLIENFQAQGMEADELAYEFDKTSRMWHPSYAILKDGRIVRLISAA